MPLRALIAVLALATASPAFAADEFRDEQWGLEMVNAPEAWSTSTGVGAVVAVVDTGVQQDHPDLGGRLLPGDSFVGGDVEDEDGHGTHVSGIVAANRDNDEGIAGIAPGARVLPLRAIDADGFASADGLADAIDRAVAEGAHVINLSLADFVPFFSSLVGDDPAYREALERAVAAGVVVVVAAGNNGVPHCENPDVADMLCVGAVDVTPTRAAYSSFGSNVDLMAPGGSCLGGSSEDILSTYIDSSYATVCGTSQATPHVAGVAALLVSLGVRGPAAVDRIVATAADSCVALMGECAAGVVDAAAAVEGLAAPPPPTDPGDPDPAAGTFSTKSPVKRRAVRRRGFRVTCEAGRPGECKVVVRRRGRRIARGRADVPAQIPTRVTATLNRRGKRVLKNMGRRLRVRVAVTLPGGAVRTRRVIVKR